MLLTMASVAASVVVAQCSSAQADPESGRQLQVASTASVSSLDSSPSSKSSLTSGYSSDSPEFPDKQGSHHSRSSDPEDEGSTKGQDTYVSDKISSSSSIPLESVPSSSENCQCCSDLPFQPQVESPPVTLGSRRRKLAITQTFHTVYPPQLSTNNVLIDDGSVCSITHYPDPRLQVTDLVMSDSEDDGDDDGEGELRLLSRKLRLGYPFTDEAVSESDYDTDSINSSRSNSRRSSVTHWN